MIQINRNSTFVAIGKAILFCIVNTVLLKLSLYIVSTIPVQFDGFVSSSIGPILVLVTTYLFIRFDKQSFSRIGLKFEPATFKKFLVGFILGLGIMSLYVLCLLYSLGLRIQPNSNISFLFLLLNVLPIIIMLAFMEEVIFRAYPLVIIKNKLGQTASLVITSLLFGFYHLFFGWGIAGFISTSTWGLAFGLLAILSKGISMPTGFHAAGNFAQLILGTTGNTYSIWHIADKNGLQIKNFVASATATIIAELVLLALIILWMRLTLRKTNYRQAQF
ncbi:MAG TPA: type II CAAX endopeptidase family protein [Panacibacter sp.]|nr:type II CAAX endopeptidase family protein [Panacibacter sp.]HNP47075.1 type II CAAX endopeptidase family protein [Panacibacter sp.]